MSEQDPQTGADGAGRPGFSFTDKRRVDPETGEVRPQGQASPAPGAAAGEQAEGAAESAPEAGSAPAAGSASAESGAADPAEAGVDPVAAPEADASDLGVEIPDDASGLGDQSAAAGEGAAAGETASAADDLAAERLADLQRINAEYAAYRMRAKREQDRAKDAGIIAVAEALVPVLDEVRLARENGDVEGPFEVHVTKLFAALEKVGVEQYGEVGEVFDPAVHEALMQQTDEDATESTVFMVMQPGYRMGERIIRAARVGVKAPAE